VVDGVDLSRIDLLSLFRISRDGKGVEEEGVLEMIENLVECLPPGRDPLRFQIGRELRVFQSPRLSIFSIPASRIAGSGFLLGSSGLR
jgi:hypothetical protein